MMKEGSQRQPRDDRSEPRHGGEPEIVHGSNAILTNRLARSSAELFLHARERLKGRVYRRIARRSSASARKRVHPLDRLAARRPRAGNDGTTVDVLGSEQYRAVASCMRYS